MLRVCTPCFIDRNNFYNACAFHSKKNIGQTTRTLEKRFSEHSEADSLLGRAIQRDGAENFSREVLVECETPEELDAQERFYIKKLDCKHPHGYNNTDGGRRSRNPKTKVEKQLDSRKEFFLKMIGAKITYYRTLRDMSQKELAKRTNMDATLKRLKTLGSKLTKKNNYYNARNDIQKFLSSIIRVLNNLSQKDLAEKSNVSAAYISQIENCRPNKGIASVVKIAQALKVPPCILLTEETCPKYLLCLEQAVSLSNID